MKDIIQKLNLRLPMPLIEEAKAQAAQIGVSLNAYILFALNEQVKRTRVQIPKPQAKAPMPSPAFLSVAKVGRNDPCPCGSGRKAKQCHPETT